MQNFFKVVSQTQPVTITKQDGTTISKCSILLQLIGGKFEDSFACTLLGNMATLKFYQGDLVFAALRFSGREFQGRSAETDACQSKNHYQDITVQDIINSPTAKARGIDNTPTVEVITNLKRLCQEVLEPLRQAMGVPIVIGSGYRCPALNTAVGGVKNSNHLTGCAADLHLPNNATGRQWMLWIVDNCQFDECIWECSSEPRGKSSSLHTRLK